jgi:EmrB/QacA subfamily drug resistance transporter
MIPMPQNGPGRPPAQERDRWWLVAGLGLAVFMAMLDMSIVNVALPVIQREFATRASVTEWVVLGYMLPLVALTLPSGRWLDRIGKRAALVLSVAGFAVASVTAGLAPGIEWLICARVVQGAFGAILFALTPALATTAVSPHARGRAMGVVATVGPLGAIAGPVIGGFLVETLGWPWIFFVNVPVSIAVIAIGLVHIPADGPLRLPDRAWAVETALLGSATVSVLLGLSLAAGRGLGWLLLALWALPALAIWRRMDSSRVVRELVRAPGLTAPHLALLLTAVAAGVVVFLTPFYLQQVLKVSASVTGLTLLGFPVAMAVLGPIGGVLTDRWGGRRTAIAGTAVLTGGLLLLVPLGGAWTPVQLAWRLGVLGAGSGLFNAAIVTLAMSISPRNLLGTTGASTSLARQLGFALGPALATVVWAVSSYTPVGMRAAFGLAAMLSAFGAVALLRNRPAITVNGTTGSNSPGLAVRHQGGAAVPALQRQDGDSGDRRGAARVVRRYTAR